MDVAETAGGDGNVLCWYLDMPVDFGSLAVQAFPGPSGDIFG
jgi:hypothetical protein